MSRSGSVVRTAMVRSWPSGRPLKRAMRRKVVDHEGGGIVRQMGASSKTTSMSQVWKACSFEPQAREFVEAEAQRSHGEGRLGPVGLAHVLERLEHGLVGRQGVVGLSRGVLAFQSSHTDGANSSGVALPARMSSRRRRIMTAPEPRCDSTWAIDHSLSYDCRSRSPSLRSPQSSCR